MSLPNTIRALAADARWLDALDALDEHEACGCKVDCPEATEVRALGRKFREAKTQYAGPWEDGYSYHGVETSFRYDGDVLWLRTEGLMDDIDLFYTVAVIREVPLFGEWVPFVRFVRVLKQLDFSRLCTHFAIGVRGILVRDCVLRASVCNSALTNSCLYFEGATPDGDEWEGAKIPPRSPGFAFDRMHIHGLHGQITFLGPTSQKCTIVVAIDLRLHVPRSLLDFFLKRLVGVFLILWRRQSRRIAKDPLSKHRVTMHEDTAFYADFLYPRYCEFLRSRGWEMPPPKQDDDEG